MQPTSQEQPGQVKRPRFVRVWIDITDSKGKAKRYTLRPLPLEPGVTKHFRLTRYDVYGNVEAHYEIVSTSKSGPVCTCKSARFRYPCKHIASLTAACIL